MGWEKRHLEGGGPPPLEDSHFLGSAIFTFGGEYTRKCAPRLVVEKASKCMKKVKNLGPENTLFRRGVFSAQKRPLKKGPKSAAHFWQKEWCLKLTWNFANGINRQKGPKTTKKITTFRHKIALHEDVSIPDSEAVFHYGQIQYVPNQAKWATHLGWLKQ